MITAHEVISELIEAEGPIDIKQYVLRGGSGTLGRTVYENEYIKVIDVLDASELKKYGVSHDKRNFRYERRRGPIILFIRKGIKDYGEQFINPRYPGAFDAAKVYGDKVVSALREYFRNQAVWAKGLERRGFVHAMVNFGDFESALKFRHQLSGLARAGVLQPSSAYKIINLLQNQKKPLGALDRYMTTDLKVAPDGIFVLYDGWEDLAYFFDRRYRDDAMSILSGEHDYQFDSSGYDIKDLVGSLDEASLNEIRERLVGFTPTDEENWEPGAFTEEEVLSLDSKEIGTLLKKESDLEDIANAVKWAYSDADEQACAAAVFQRLVDSVASEFSRKEPEWIKHKGEGKLAMFVDWSSVDFRFQEFLDYHDRPYDPRDEGSIDFLLRETTELAFPEGNPNYDVDDEQFNELFRELIDEVTPGWDQPAKAQSDERQAQLDIDDAKKTPPARKVYTIYNELNPQGEQFWMTPDEYRDLIDKKPHYRSQSLFNSYRQAPE